MRFIGLDAGSVSVKVIVLDEEGTKVFGSYKRHGGQPLKTALAQLKEAKAEGGDFCLSVTGSGGRLIASVLGIEPVNEIVSQAYAVRKLYPHIRSIIELGGEDSKLIILEDGVKDFSMNSVCAAGTGAFLDQQAERLKLTIEQMSSLSLRAERPPRIAGRCSVFAKSDMIHLQQIATPVQDIVAGLCFAVARNFKGSISRGRQIIMPVSFQGGVAANKGMVRAFKEVFELQELFVPPDFALMGAWGACLKAIDDNNIQKADINALEEFLAKDKTAAIGHKPLIEQGDDFFLRHKEEAGNVLAPASKEKIEAYMGIDVGSISTNLAVIDSEGRLLAKRYLMTAGRPIEAVRQGLKEIAGEVGDKAVIMAVGTTGSGRYMIADYVGADIVKNEITAQATAATFIDKTVDTIFEIGGQDSKYICLRHGVIVDFEMNKACAAGTGSFLEEQAEKLSISIKDEFAEYAFSSANPMRLGERCTVFMENSLMANLQKGAKKQDLLSGLAYSIVQNYINRVVAGKHIGDNIFFQGGVAFNKAVVAAFEKYLGKKITVPPHHDVTGAIGMALIAGRIRNPKEGSMTRGSMTPAKAPPASTFKGFTLSDRPYKVSSFECRGCPNMCEINKVKIQGEDSHLFYGGRCEKYDVRRKKPEKNLPDLFSLRQSWLRQARPLSELAGDSSPFAGGRAYGDTAPPAIGIPYIFFFHDHLPFWVTLIQGLGFNVEVSPTTNRDIVNIGLESVLSEACFPVKVAHGHIKYLMDKKVDAILIPSVVSTGKQGDEFLKASACPYTQTIPYVARIALHGLNALTPVVDASRARAYLVNEIKQAFKKFGLRGRVIQDALSDAQKAQETFESSIKEKGKEVLAGLNGQKAVVVVGRSYNSFENGMNLAIPEKLANLGMPSMPMDFLPLEDIKIKPEWPNMYWRSGQNILKAARFIRQSPNLYPIFIGNFLCGPDSFILKYFKRELGLKPFLHIEIDEHSADAGAITRVEAFLDSIGGSLTPAITADTHTCAPKGVIDPRVISPPFAGARSSNFAGARSSNFAGARSSNFAGARSSNFAGARSPQRTVYIPRMSDHAFALQAAFERSGVPSEVLPESDKETVDLGMKYVSGKECYPCLVTTGDMLKKVFQGDFRPEESAFFMPSGTGPCRFGQYNVFHSQVLEGIGLDSVPIFAPNQDAEFYKDLGIVGKDFSSASWRGIVAIELLYKCLHETRPYERQNGSADELYMESLKKLCLSLRSSNGKTDAIDDVLKDIRQGFEAIPRYKEKKPLIGIVGEIFVRSHKFSNEDLVRKIEALGGEVWLAPVEEWIYYVNYIAGKRALLKKSIPDIISISLTRFFQRRTEKRYAGCFRGLLKTLHEPSTKETLRSASPYVHDSFEGETILSIGKAIDLSRKGASGIVNAMPFGCMPGTIVTALMRGISRQYDIPSISIPYDGTESSAMTIQLEAFMEQTGGH